MLARSLPGSSDSSGPPSPRRRTIQPARSRLSSPPVVPPPDAEFIGSAPAPPSPSHGISETAFSPHYFEKFFVIEKELGKGGRGVVLLVKHILDGVTLGHFACKRVPVGDDHAWLEKVLVEVQALQALSHQNLVSYRHVWLEDYQLNSFMPSVPCAFILQQYCNGGDLHNFICGSAKVSVTTNDLKDRLRRKSRGEAEMPRKTNEPKKLSFDLIYSFFRDITDGLRFLHLNGFIHRDLKPSNCLLHTVGGEMRVLVSDFGEVQYENALRKSTGATGTISYCAPEVLLRESPDGPFGNFTFKSDIFSLGMILHFLCFADLPYRYANVLHEEQEDLNALRAEIMSWSGFDDHRKLRPDLPSKLYSFLKRLLSLRPDDRPTADEVNNGIRIGGLDQVPELRRRQSAVPEELTPGKRVQKIDTPVRGQSPKRGLGREFVEGTSSGLLRRRRTPSLESSKINGTVDSSSDIAVEDDETPGSHDMERSLSGPVRFSQPLVQSSFSSAQHNSSSPDRHHQLLLPSPRPTPTRSVLHNAEYYFSSPITSPIVKITILALKIITVLQPCMSKGMNASILYPLLTLALMDLMIFPLQVWMATASMMIHMAVLWYAVSSDSLCSRRSASWVEGTELG
jgi:serine/threonine protein kinase